MYRVHSRSPPEQVGVVHLINTQQKALLRRETPSSQPFSSCSRIPPLLLGAQRSDPVWIVTTGHSVVLSADETSVLIWGGGDNDGTYFNDTQTVAISEICDCLAS